MNIQERINKAERAYRSYYDCIHSLGRVPTDKQQKNLDRLGDDIATLEEIQAALESGS